MNEHASSPATPRSAVSNAIWNAFSTSWGIAISFVLAPLLIRQLGTDQYGILLIIWSVTGMLGVMNFGMGEATLRYVAMHFARGDLAGVNRVMGSTLTFYLIVCVVAVSGLFLAAPHLAHAFNIPDSQADLVEWLLRLSAVIFSLGIASRAYGAVPMALHRYDISSKIGVVQSVVRSGGYVVLALLGFGLGHIVAWDLVALLATLVAQAMVIRRIAPGVRLTPTFSFKGMKEIFGFSIFSFLTYVFYMLHRESGKMILGARLGPTPVAHLGTPDNVAHRLHMVVASGSETLMPRFSATADVETRRALLANGIWASLAVSQVMLIPLIVLMPDLLALWIDPEFARSSALIGQFVALSYISQGAYTPVATYFRGIGKPWVVTIAVLAAGLTMLVSSLALVSRHGATGIGYAYALASIPALVAVGHGWFHLFGRSSVAGFLRMVLLPLGLGAVAYVLLATLRSALPTMNWPVLLGSCASFAGITAGLLFGTDWLLGGPAAPSRRCVSKALESRHVRAVRNLVFRRP